jgi:hypothetical protein
MARSGGRDYIIFPSKTKLLNYLTVNKVNAINDYVELVNELGFDLTTLDETHTGKLRIQSVRDNIFRFIEIIKELK